MAGFLDTLFSGGAEREAADKNRALLAQYGPQAQGYLQQGYDTGTADINKGIAGYDPLSALATKYGAATDMYTNALGLNGPQGNAIASGAFQHNPGYEGAVTAGLDILNRRRAGQGMLNSGNADLDALTFGQNLENQQYGSWLDRLSGLNTLGAQTTGQVAAGQMGGYTNLANLASKYAGDQTGVAGNVLSGNVNANNLQASGEAAGAKNLLGAGLSLATLAMGGFGGGGFANSLMGAGLGNAMGGSYGGSAQAPLPGLTAADYGPGASLFDTYGIG
jgi:hypothetical protein